MAEPPRISWAGPLDSATPATSLPSGVNFPITSASIGGPLHDRLTADIAGSPVIDGIPCVRVDRPFTCQGVPRGVGSPAVHRFRTDAPVLELVGVVPDGNQSVQTLLIDGALVLPTVLTSSRARGGWNFGAVRVDFGTRQVREIWIETGLYAAYLRLDSGDTLYPFDDRTEPQLTVIGDSYLLQTSATFGNSGAIALELGVRLGVRRVAVDAIGGTGYYNGGGGLGSLNDRLPAHAADASSVYLVMAGLNDYANVVASSPPALAWPIATQYQNAVLSYLLGLRQANADALIVVTAPFCPVPPMSDSSYVANAASNTSGLGDNLFKAQTHLDAIRQVAAPWVYIDVLMGGGWLNSSGARGDVTNLQWLTGGTPGAGTTATYKPGNTGGGGGGGFGGIAAIPIVAAGNFSQAPEVYASGGSGTGLLLAARIDASGQLTSINVVSPGSGYGDGAGLPTIHLDPTFESAAATTGTPALIAGLNLSGQYPLPAAAPSGTPLSALNNIATLLQADEVHPSPLGVEYLSTRLAESLYAALQAL